jgi:lipopolysaccharide transport system permease protein
MMLLMYATPIMYPVSAIPSIYKPYLFLNPISPMIEIFRYIFTGSGMFSWFQLLYSFVFGFIVLIIGVFVFHHTEKTFMDTV